MRTPVRTGEKNNTMEIVIGAVGVALGLGVGLVAAASLLARRARGVAARGGNGASVITPAPAGAATPAPAAGAEPPAVNGAPAHHADLVRLEERLRTRE